MGLGEDVYGAPPPPAAGPLGLPSGHPRPGPEHAHQLSLIRGEADRWLRLTVRAGWTGPGQDGGEMPAGLEQGECHTRVNCRPPSTLTRLGARSEIFIESSSWKYLLHLVVVLILVSRI